MNINIQNCLVAPIQGDSYWFGPDLYTFKMVEANTGQTAILLEGLIQPQSGIPLHIHHYQEEYFYIIEGKFQFQLDREIVIATAGKVIHSPQEQVHQYINIGSTAAKLLIWQTPAGFENFLAEIAIKAANPLESSPPANLPDLERIIVIGRKHGITIFKDY
ncbi:MAG: cupin domain-containing protein [Prochloraceae cyanobacterium]|nr:cupin domain-containing protein [Prochloraceae cyanobacterium]